MSTVETLPKGLKPETFEKGNPPLSRIPPIRFVPNDLEYIGRGNGKPQKIKITISGDIQKEFHILVKGGMEDAYKQCLAHSSLIREKKFAEHLDANKRLIAQKTSEYESLQKKNSSSSRLLDISEALAELEHNRKDLKNGIFDLFGSLVSDDLRKKWEIIVARECDSPNYVDLDGKRQAIKRGRSVASVVPCYTHFLRLFGPQDSAERQKNYIQQLLRLIFDICNVEQAFFRVAEMNGYIKWLPCLKNEENSPAEMERILPLNGFELCGALVRSLPRSIETAYTVAGPRFECNVANLCRKIEDIVDNQKTKQAEVKAIVHSMGITTEDGRIPKKSARSNNNNNHVKKQGGGGPAKGDRKSAGGTRVVCAYCDKWKPNGNAKYTHTTEQCNTFNADGSRKKRAPREPKEEGEVARSRSGRYNNRIRGARSQEFQELERELKRTKYHLKKFQKREKKRKSKSRRGRARSPSYSSGSDSASDMSY